MLNFFTEHKTVIVFFMLVFIDYPFVLWIPWKPGTYMFGFVMIFSTEIEWIFIFHYVNTTNLKYYCPGWPWPQEIQTPLPWVLQFQLKVCVTMSGCFCILFWFNYTRLGLHVGTISHLKYIFNVIWQAFNIFIPLENIKIDIKTCNY